MALEINTAATPPPVATAKRRGRPPGSGSRVKSAEDIARREKGLKDLTGLGVGVLVMTKQYADAGALTNHGDPICTEVAKLAAQHEGVASVVDKMIDSGPYAGLIAAVMPLALQLAVNHGLIKSAPSMGGKIVPKEILEGHVKGELDRQAAAQRAQYQADLDAQADAMRDHIADADAAAAANGRGRARR